MNPMRQAVALARSVLLVAAAPALPDNGSGPVHLDSFGGAGGGLDGYHHPT